MISKRVVIRVAQVALVLMLGLLVANPPQPALAGGECDNSDCQDACGADLGDGCYEAATNPNECRCVVFCEGNPATHEFPPCAG